MASFLQTQLGEGRGSCREHCSERGNAPSPDSLGFAPLPWDPHQVRSLVGLSKLIFPCHHRSLKGMYRSRGQMPGSVLLNTLLAGGGGREMGRSPGQVLTWLRGHLNHSWICSSCTSFIFFLTFIGSEIVNFVYIKISAQGIWVGRHGDELGRSELLFQILQAQPDITTSLSLENTNEMHLSNLSFSFTHYFLWPNLDFGEQSGACDGTLPDQNPQQNALSAAQTRTLPASLQNGHRMQLRFTGEESQKHWVRGQFYSDSVHSPAVDWNSHSYTVSRYVPSYPDTLLARGELSEPARWVLSIPPC